MPYKIIEPSTQKKIETSWKLEKFVQKVEAFRKHKHFFFIKNKDVLIIDKKNKRRMAVLPTIYKKLIKVGVNSSTIQGDLCKKAN